MEVSKIYPLDATAQALRDVQHHHIGKLAIRSRSAGADPRHARVAGEDAVTRRS